jgi:hypothetical protein
MAISRGLIALVILATLGAAELAIAAGPPDGLNVQVINTPANPVPVTGSVTGSVTGTVGLAPGTSVGLTPGTSVMIDSTVGDPVRVRNVNDAIQPAQAQIACISPSVTIGCGPVTIYTVPAGKRLVIEYASMSACMLPGQTATLTVSTEVGSTLVHHLVNVTPPAAGPGTGAIGCNLPAASSVTAVGQQVRLYADPGTTVTVEGDRNSNTGAANFVFSISGYLVDVPLTP